jgi:glycosyltransferase involved in cell wall biosynthesis
MAARLAAEHPALAGRLVATGPLEAADVSRHLQVCDLVIQAYPDGVTGRRGSVMAALGHGLAVVTNRGRLTEPVWDDSGGVALASGSGPDELAAAADRLLADPGARAQMQAAARVLYDQRFALERTIEAIVGAPLAVPS